MCSVHDFPPLLSDETLTVFNDLLTPASMRDSPTTDSSRGTCCPSWCVRAWRERSKTSRCILHPSVELGSLDVLFFISYVYIHQYNVHQPALGSNIDSALITGGEVATASALLDFDAFSAERQ